VAASDRAVRNETVAPHYTFLQRLSLALVSWVVPALVLLIGSTLRIRFSLEEGSITRIEDIQPGVFPFWHNCVLPAMWVFRRQRLAVITSRSLDGEFIARVIARLGYVPIRGSSSRGGQQALLEMAGFVQRGGGAAFTIDGPRGPRHVAKKGPIQLARLTGIAITPFYIAAEKKWELNSWDRFVIPRPFSRVLVRVGAKINVPQGADGAVLESCYQQMQAGLERSTRFAEEEFAAGWDSGFAVDMSQSRR
jgi:lysophospholipid acyltransferase (LPLAT)-like uncharacterized protein